MAGDAPKVWFSNGSAPTARRGLQLALRTDSARRTVQPGERWTVWVKTHTGNLSKLKGVDPDCDVYDLAELWAGKFELSMHTTGVTLRVVKCGPGVPDEKEEAAAKHRKPLEPRLTLRVAGLADGSSLLADVDPAQAGPEAAASNELAQRVARLELQQQQQQRQHGAHVFSPTALATSYRNAVHDRRVVPSPAVMWFRPADPPVAVLDALRGQQLAPDAPESQVQAFMERVGQLFAASDPASSLLLVGCSSTPTVGTRKPDLVGYLAAPPVAGQRRAPRPVSYDVLHAVLVGELTLRRAASSEGRFTAEEKGGVLSFLEDLVQEQLWRAGGGDRARVLAFLSDGVHIVFFQCTFACELAGGRPTVSLHEAQECGPFPLAGEGAALLTGLLKASPSQLGYDLPRCVPDVGGGEIALRAYLGAGATSLGFTCEWQGRAAVLKQYHAAAPGALAAAVRAELDALRAAVEVRGVCQLLGTARGAAGQACVVLAPVGAVTYSLRAASPAGQAAAPPPSGLWLPADVPAATAHRVGPLLPGAAEFCDLVDALAGLHAAGWVHRDPRPANFYRDAAGRFVLADLGSAARIGDGAAAADGRPWAFHFGPLDALLALRDGAPLPPPQPAHDFEQLARLVYAAQACDGDALPPPHPRAAAELCDWWQARDSTVVLASLLRAADAAAAGGVAERELLKAAIRAVFPASF